VPSKALGFEITEILRRAGARRGQFCRLPAKRWAATWVLDDFTMRSHGHAVVRAPRRFKFLKLDAQITAVA